MASRKRETYQIEPRIMPPMLELDDESKISKNLSAIKEICSWLQTFRPSNPGGSQEHNLVAFFFLLLFDHLCYMMDIVQVTSSSSSSSFIRSVAVADNRTIQKKTRKPNKTHQARKSSYSGLTT